MFSKLIISSIFNTIEEVISAHWNKDQHHHDNSTSATAMEIVEEKIRNCTISEKMFCIMKLSNIFICQLNEDFNNYCYVKIDR